MAQNVAPALVREEPEARAGRIARDSNGDPIGVALFFTSEELSDIGVNTAAADSVELHVENGDVRLVPISLKQNDSN